MTSPPAFTVLLNAYNEERLIGEAIRSVLAQSRGDFELVVVDDGSTDGTSRVVEGFLADPRISLIRQRNRGPAPSRNVAAAAGSAPRLALIDADDLWFPQYLEEMGAALDEEPDAGFAYTDAWWFQEASGRFFRKSSSEYLGAPERPPEDPHEMLLSLLSANWIFGLTVIQRSAFDDVGGFDESLGVGEDYELWLRLLASGYRAVRVPGRLVVQRERRGSLSRDMPSMLRNLEGVYRIVAEKLDVPGDVRDAARARLARVDRHRNAEGRSTNPLSLWWRARHQLGRLRKQLFPQLVWHGGIPPEVRSAFPETDFAKPANESHS
jgi:glycosyltransferase involved in cell wall biosynthesis